MSNSIQFNPVSSADGNWTISKVQLPIGDNNRRSWGSKEEFPGNWSNTWIPNFTAHEYIVVHDQYGNIKHEFHGLAVALGDALGDGKSNLKFLKILGLEYR